MIKFIWFFIFFVGAGFVILTRDAMSSESTLSVRHDATIELAGKQLFVQLADDPDERERGLGGVRSLSDDVGMLFTFDDPMRPVFWMQGMRMSIDLVWLNDGEVIGWVEDLPLDDGQRTYQPDEPIDRVLELRAGWIAEYGLEVGDTVSI